MPAPKEPLSAEAQETLKKLIEVREQIQRVTEKRDRLLLEITDKYGVYRTARGLGVSEDGLRKRVARLRERYGAGGGHQAA